MAESSLSDVYLSCIHNWGLFLVNLRADHCYIVQQEQVDLSRVTNEYARVKIWGEQTKAYLPARARGSLDDTLRSDDELKKTVESMLERMAALLSEAINISKKKVDDFDNSDESYISDVSADSEYDSDEESEDRPYRVPKIQLILDYTYQQISSLFDLSSLLRRPTIGGKYIRSVGKKKTEPEDEDDYDSDEEFSKPCRTYDLNHVTEKLRLWRGFAKDAQAIEFEDEIPAEPERGMTSEGTEDILWLCQRLADAGVRRREQLRYWVRKPYSRSSKANALPNIPIMPKKSLSRRGDKTDSARSEATTLKPSTKSAPSTMGDNTVTTISKESFSTAAVSDIHTAATEDNRPRTVYAPSLAGGRATNSVPKAPIVAKGSDSVPCPYCGQLLKSEDVNNRQRWKRHVFRDLRPYVCTFEDCQNHSKLYITRNDWIHHELQIHQRQFVCTICGKKCAHRNQLAEHLRLKHEDSVSPAQLSIILELSDRPKDETEQDACIFCGETMSLLTLQSHTAGHLEDLALFALTPSAGADTDDSEASVKVGSRESRDKDDGDESSNGSSLHFGEDEEDMEEYETFNASLNIIKQLQAAQEVEYETKVEEWKRREKDDEQPPPETTPNEDLIEAVKSGDEEALQLSLEKGAELETQDEDFDRTPLLWAAERGFDTIARSLVSHGANIQATDMGGQTPLSLAARNGHTEIVRLLLDAGSAVDVKDSDFGQTPLSWASERGFTEVVRLLLDKGADFECKDQDFQQSPLSMASENGHMDIIRLLVEKGADVQSKDVGGRTPLSWAASNGHEDAVRLLRKVMKSKSK